MTNISMPLSSGHNTSLTIYCHKASPELGDVAIRPTILIMPGGGYRNCSDREAEPIAIAYYNQGYNACILRYSIKMQAAFPAPVEDAEEAIDLLKKYAKDWCIDTEAIFACGFSAGGHLAAALGTMSNFKPRGLILAYPMILASEDTAWPFPIPAMDQKVDATTPPNFIAHTWDDDVVPIDNALAWIQACRKHNVAVEAHLFRSGQHGLSLGTPFVANNDETMVNPHFAHWFQLSVEWIEEIVNQ